MAWIDKRDELQLLGEVDQIVKNKKQKKPQDVMVGQRLTNIYRRHPYIPTGVALSLAEAGADMATVDAIALKSSMTKLEKVQNEGEQSTIIPQSQRDDKSIWRQISDATQKALGWGVKPSQAFDLGKKISDLALPDELIKAGSRYGLAASSFGFQYAANYGSLITDPNQAQKRADAGSRWVLPENMFASTTLGALLQYPELQGEGWFASSELEEKREEKVRKFRWQIEKDMSYTIGRGAANVMFTPGSLPFNIVSGAIDATVAFQADFLNKPVSGVAKAIKAAKVLPFIETADEISAARKLAQDQAGLLSTAEQHAIDTSKFFGWLNGPTGRRVVERTALETNELKMLEAYNYRITPQQARELASATDPEQVKGIIASAAVRLSDETLEGTTPFATSSDQLPIAAPWNPVVEQIPGYNNIRNSRWWAKTPKDQLLVSGTPQQKTESIKNLKNFLVLLGQDPYSGDGKKLMDVAFDWAGADGTKTDANKMLRLFLGDKQAGITGILPMTLRKEGVPEDVIDELDAVFRDREKLLRNYSFNSAGKADDHGMMVHMTSQMDDDPLRELLTDLFPTKVGPKSTREEMDNFVASLNPGELQIISPLSISQMLNNVVTLPDPRAIRRIMTNPFYTGKKTDQYWASEVLESIQNELWRPYALATGGFIMRNTFDAQTRIAMFGLSTSNPLDYILTAVGLRGGGTLLGATWKSADVIPRNVIGKLRMATDPADIRNALAEYIPLDAALPDSVLDDLVAANTNKQVKEILDRVRPDEERLDEYIDFTRSFAKRMIESPREQVASLVEDGQVAIVDPSSPTFAKALADQAGLIFGDPIQQLAVRIAHLPEDKQKDVVVKFLDSESSAARRARRIIQDALSSPVVANQNNGANAVRASIPGVGRMTTEELVDAWYTTGAREQVDLYIQQSDELRAFAGYNAVPTAPAEIIDNATAQALSGGQKIKAGDILVKPGVSGAKDKALLVLEVSKVAKKTARYKVIEVEDFGVAFRRSGDKTVVSPRATRFLRELMKRNAEAVNNGLDPLVPPRALLRVETPALRGVTDKTIDRLAKPARWFFRAAVDPFTRNFERSPAFRKNYYNVIAENARLLEAGQIDRLLDVIEDSASKTFPKTYARDRIKAMEHYVGGKKVYEALMAAGDAPAGSRVGTLEQLEAYAMSRTKLEMEELFFNNVERSNFTDAMRVVAPFGAAWAEIMGTYAKAFAQNPARLRKATLVYKGLEEWDPDNDGRGFFWTDPQSKMTMFAFPLSSAVIKVLTTLSGKDVPETFLAAPTSRLSAGFSLVPSVGPVYQIAASVFFDKANLPDTDAFRKLILPYGSTGAGDLVPGTWAKLFDALRGDPSKLTTMYGNTYQDVFAHLASTGEYDLTDANDVTRLDEDAREGARGLLMVRALSQFVGPTAGSPQYRYQKESGEFYYVNEMVRAFSQFQNENYDTAVKRFIETFGEDAYIYLSGKTKIDESYKGIESTEAFGRWEQDNRGLIAGFKKTAPFLAPGGFGELSMEVYSRLLGAGVIKDRDNRDRLADAQRRIGSALYRHIRSQFPDTLNENQRLQLQNFRNQIHDQYPGFPKVVEFKVGEFENFIDELGRLVQDPRTEGNPVRDTIWDYLKYRANVNYALKRDHDVSLAATSNQYAAQARGLLYARGEALAKMNPDFRRIWDQELASEVE